MQALSPEWPIRPQSQGSYREHTARNLSIPSPWLVQHHAVPRPELTRDKKSILPPAYRFTQVNLSEGFVSCLCLVLGLMSVAPHLCSTVLCLAVCTRVPCTLPSVFLTFSLNDLFPECSHTAYFSAELFLPLKAACPPLSLFLWHLT